MLAVALAIFIVAFNVLLDNFGASIGRTDFENAIGITLATREKSVAAYCAAQGVRFVVLQNPRPYYPALAEASGFPRQGLPDNSLRGLLEAQADASHEVHVLVARVFEGGRGRPERGSAGAAFQDFQLVRVEAEPERSNIGSAVQIWQFAPRDPSPSK